MANRGAHSLATSHRSLGFRSEELACFAKNCDIFAPFWAFRFASGKDFAALRGKPEKTKLVEVHVPWASVFWW
jgi:hypothetical protein